MAFKLCSFAFVLSGNFAAAWIQPHCYEHKIKQLTTKLDAEVGIFYGTSTGNTFDCAEKIYEAFGSDIAANPIDVDSLDGDQLAASFAEHNALVVGTPTWNTGADSKRSGTGWDEIYYSKLPAMKDVLQGKKVAVFGLGDQSSYSSNFADATGELYDVFKSSGCNMIDASWSQDGYEHDASKSIRDGKFCGLILDMINQEDLTDERVTKWVSQLKQNGLLDDGDSLTSISLQQPAAAVVTAAQQALTIEISVDERIAALEKENNELRKMLENRNGATNFDITSAKSSRNAIEEFTPYFNPVTRKTMWISQDGRKSYFS